MDRLRVSGLGVGVELQLSGSRSEDLGGLLRSAWARCLDRPAELEADPITLSLETPAGASEPASPRGSAQIWTNDADSLMVMATQAVTAALIKAQAGRLLMFHAGALSHPDTGASVVFVAPGGTGKTTLARRLGHRYGYLTDETVGIDPAGRILPYPKPLSLRTEGAAYKREFSPDDLGLLPAHPKPFVARIIMIERSDLHQDDPVVEELPLLTAISGLAPESSSLSSLDRGLHRCADLIEATGPVLRVRYSEADGLLGLMSELVGGSPGTASVRTAEER